MKTLLSRSAPAALVAVLLLGAAPLLAAEEKKGWGDTAELSFVSTSGNTETTTLGAKNKLWWLGDRSRFESKAGAIRARSITRRYAVGDPNGNYRVFEDNDLTAENYYVDARYDRKISNRFFWFGGAGWDKNEFAGIDSRTTAFGGVGNIWYSRDDLRFRTDYSVTYTDQKNVVDDPDFDETFSGLRFSWAYLNKFGDNTTYTNDLVLNYNAEESEDWRADMINAVTVALSAKMALKVTHQLLYDNLPSFEEVDIFDINPDRNGANNLGTVPVELDEVDTILTVSLVVNF